MASLPTLCATPPPEDQDNPTNNMGSARGLGLQGIPEATSPGYTVMDDSLLSAEPPETPRAFGSMSSTMPSALPTPALTLSPASSGDNSSEFASMDADDSALSTDPNSGPFRFKSRTYTANTGASLNRHGSQKSVVSHTMGQRRGHRYKHSSVSHQIFLEPPPRAPLRLPASLPIPTTREGWHSMSTEQTMRVCWCFCHLFVAAYVQWTAQGSLALTALSHLIFYDAIGAFLCASVEVLSNFEVWKRSSIRQPFGLERSEVLVGFAMSILLLFMGFDLISHNMAHILDSSTTPGDHEPHRPHNHGRTDPSSSSTGPVSPLAPQLPHDHARVSPGSIDLTSLLAIASTLISAIMLQNHARMARSMRLARIDFLPVWLNNPSHLLTLSCSTLLLLMPLLSFDMYTWLDRALSTSMALAMCILGYQLVKTLGAMLLMSYSPPTDTGSSSVTPSAISGTVAEVVRDISSDPSVSDIIEAKFWQVHYGLCLANLKLQYQGTEDGLVRLKERVSSLVKNRLGGGYGGGSGAAWEVSVECVWDGRGPGADLMMR